MSAIRLRPVTFTSVWLMLGVLAMLGWARSGAPAARAAGTTPDLAIAIDVNGGGDDCDTRPGGVGTTCNVTVGSMFTVSGHVDGIAGLLDGNLNSQMGYLAVQFRLLHTAGLTLNNAVMSNPDNELGFPSPFWEGCEAGSSRSESQSSGQYNINCFTTGAEDTDAPDKIIEVDYTCSSAGMGTITMEDSATYVHNDLHGNTPLDKEGDEVLTINCTAPVGGIAELPDVAGASPLAAEDESGSSLGLVAAFATAGAAITVIGGFAWRRRRARAR